GVPDDVPEVTVQGPLPLFRLVSKAGLSQSNNEARRLVDQGAVSLDGEKLSDPTREIPLSDEPILLKVGKRRFARVRIEG
ncbi:MAG: S4 domain-containing protein, partial [Thermoanaerobaculia bacterium]|nr:S4 domain-containing protein [Thermoanaerobaculia bacterium]